MQSFRPSGNNFNFEACRASLGHEIKIFFGLMGSFRNSLDPIPLDPPQCGQVNILTDAVIRK